MGTLLYLCRSFPGGPEVKVSACNAGDASSIPGSGRSSGEGNTHSSILVWRIPWTEEPGRLHPTGSQKVRHDWATSRKEKSDHQIPFYTQLIWAGILGQRKYLRNMFATPYMQRLDWVLKTTLGNFVVTLSLSSCLPAGDFVILSYQYIPTFSIDFLFFFFNSGANIGPSYFSKSLILIDQRADKMNTKITKN